MAQSCKVVKNEFLTILQLCDFGGQPAERCELRGEVKAEQEDRVTFKLYNFADLAPGVLPQGISKGGASTGLNFATLGRACLGST